MQYTIKRGEQTFGPYSLSDLQRYMQSGNVLGSDLAQSEGMTDWLPVSQILGDIPAPIINPYTPEVIPPANQVELPPNLHWSIVLILGFLTRGLFNVVWALIQANWSRKLNGENKAMVLVAMYPAGTIAGFIMIFALRDQGVGPAFGVLFVVAGYVVYLFGMFAIKGAVEDYYNSTENIGLTLSGVMTFFFGTTYIQYHVNRLHRWKKSGTPFPA